MSAGHGGREENITQRKNSVLVGFAPGKLPACLRTHPVCWVPWLLFLLGNPIRPHDKIPLSPPRGKLLTTLPLRLSLTRAATEKKSKSPPLGPAPPSDRLAQLDQGAAGGAGLPASSARAPAFLGTPLCLPADSALGFPVACRPLPAPGHPASLRWCTLPRPCSWQALLLHCPSRPRHRQCRPVESEVLWAD